MRPPRWRVDAHDTRLDCEDRGDRSFERKVTSAENQISVMVKSNQVKPLALLGNVDTHRDRHQYQISASGFELLVANLKPARIRLGRDTSGHPDCGSVHLLESMFEHRSVDFVEEPAVDLHFQMRRDAEKMSIEGGMVDLAKSHSVGNDGIATLLRISDDVSCVK
jgi:hypothetical protein